MSVSNNFGNRTFKQRFFTALEFETLEYVPADNWALPIEAPPWIILNPAGAVDVLMPAADGNKGKAFIISNISANAITLKTSGDAAFTTAIVLAGGETTMVLCTGSATAALGWRGMATAAST